MPDTQPLGRFCWYDLVTTDPDAAVAFYNEILGWGTETWDGGETPYRMWTNDSQPFGGVMELPEVARNAGSPPHWLGYVSTPDIAATMAKAEERGANIMVPPTPIPTVGHFSVFADPQGAALCAFQPESETPGNDGPAKHGEVSWRELMTTDYEAAADFYGDVFGWEKLEAMDMGPAGIYQMYGTSGQPPVGGMFNKPPEVPAPAWLYYVTIPDLDATLETVKANGGNVLHGPMEVPGGDRVATCTDPQGAAFALHQKAG